MYSLADPSNNVRSTVDSEGKIPLITDIKGNLAQDSGEKNVVVCCG